MAHRSGSDHYRTRARAEGYAARSVYKLRELHTRHRLPLDGADAILDLGAAPGSWSQYVLRHTRPPTRVVSVDLEPIEPLDAERHVVITGDFTAAPIVAAIEQCSPYRVVVCDAAPHTTGNRLVDTARSEHLVSAAAAIADRVLSPGGVLVCKLFQGGRQQPLIERLRQRYAGVRRYKPAAVRKESMELYVIAFGRT